MKEASIKKDFTKNLLLQLNALQNEAGILDVVKKAIENNDKPMLDSLLSPSKQLVENWLILAAKLAKIQRDEFINQPWAFLVKKEFFKLVKDKLDAEQNSNASIILKPVSQKQRNFLPLAK